MSTDQNTDGTVSVTKQTVAKDSTTSAPVKRGGFRYSNLGVGVKIGLGSAMILAFLATVATVSIFGLSGAAENFGDYRSLARQTNQMGRIQANLLTARLGVKDYILKGSPEAAKKVNDRIGVLSGLIEEAKELFRDPKNIESVESAAKEMREYRANFGKVIQFRKERNALIDQMNTLGPKSERGLTKIMESAFQDGDAKASFLAGQTLRRLLLARLYSNRFLVDNQKASGERAITELVEFGKLAAQMRSELQNPVRQKLAAEVLEMSKGYQSTFKKVQAVIFERNSVIRGTLDRIGPKVADSMEQIKLDNKKLQDDLGPRATKAMETSVSTALIISGIAILLGAVLAFFTGRAISRPVTDMTSAMGDLANGNLEVDIPAADRTDEIGQMANAVQVFKDNAIEVDRLQKARAEQERLAEEEKRATMNKLADDFESSVSDVVNTVSSASTELQSTAQQMTSTADQTKQQAGNVASASEEASQNVQTVAAAAEELTSSIGEINRQITDSNKISQMAVANAEATNESVQGLAMAAQKIGDVVSLIQDIAAQTNLLALNATIEAARAGEAGKGFAVVASEVKSLATQTAKATEEISAQIQEMQEATGGTVKSIEEISGVISQISTNAASIASAIEEQSASTQEISRNVQQAAKGTQEVTSNIGAVGSAAEEAGAAASQVLSSSGELSQQSELLRGQVEKFISQLRAA